MRRHDLDVLSLVAGLVFLGVALLCLSAGITDAQIRGQLIAPAVLISLGAGGIAASVRRVRSSGERQGEPSLAEPGIEEPS